MKYMQCGIGNSDNYASLEREIRMSEKDAQVCQADSTSNLFKEIL